AVRQAAGPVMARPVGDALRIDVSVRSKPGAPAPRTTSPKTSATPQLALHRTRTAYEEYVRALAWSADPLPGWETEKQLHSGFRSSKPASFGYTEEQHAEVARFRAELLELSIAVSTHPFWDQVERGQRQAEQAQSLEGDPRKLFTPRASRCGVDRTGGRCCSLWSLSPVARPPCSLRRCFELRSRGLL
ncbi:hypothetical protein ABZ154_34910, partial [Streptomyces sp. NPDC006261]|uniref:hypothetical protein n=1 Tax=Streptomyces sp. NPDC006261 TaxID=3156739 RepID=UPI0033B4A83A